MSATTAEQLDLFAAPLPPDPFSLGMELSARAAAKWSSDELAAVDDAIRSCAYFLPTFTADDVWRRLPDGFPVTKGLAARLNVAARAGLIVATDRTRKSSRGGAHDHGQRLTIWRSLGALA
jgi:hypothetical protein